MARVRYRGDHCELSFAFRIPGSGTPLLPAHVIDRYGTRRLESVCLPAGVWRTVNPFVAIFCAASRRRSGPWFDVRLSPPEWREIRRRAPWLRKATGQRTTSRNPFDAFDAFDAIELMDADVVRGLVESSHGLLAHRVL